ncbi:CocE/NonD family hydrolase C-terminal non-catalytic domain-containing protein [Streptomyces phaeochromogenes]|uniref:CocE/NonD family hydrolase C-terminal non-catalytic domain-containing protein n=1 Tax=Streptomyces phaeochromogenes TaxID=1923 RepID=UPI00398D4338
MRRCHLAALPAGGPGLVTSGEIQRVTVKLTPTSYLFLPGHAARLQISSSSYPLQDINPNTGDSSLQSSASVITRQTVLHDSEHLSVLVLPVIPTSSQSNSSTP